MINLLRNKSKRLQQVQMTQKFGSLRGRLEQIMIGIKFYLNRIAQEERKQYSQTEITTQKVPKTSLEAQQKFTDHQQQLSKTEEHRLKRIDEILGTKTYYHQTKLYQQRLDSEHVMSIQLLKKKYKQISRENLNFLNPQIKEKFKMIGRKKKLQKIGKLSTYPEMKPGILNLGDEQHPETIDMLGQQALFTKLSLSEMDMTLESLANETIETQQLPLIIGQYTYFRPESMLSIFRIRNSSYKPELITSIMSLASMQSELERIITVDEIYSCLQEYDYDERVHEYLKKVENNKLEYLISGIYPSKDGQELGIMIDLLGTKKEYCWLYRRLAKEKWEKDDVEFNVKPHGVIVNRKTYLVQRSEEGLFCELLQKDQHGNRQILYRCAPYQQIQLLPTKNHLILQQTELSEQSNNELFIYQDGQFIKINPGAETQRLNQQLLEEKTLPPKKYHYKCLEVEGKGLILVRYHLCSGDEHLKYGYHQMYGYYISLLPYVQTSGKQHIGMIEQAPTEGEQLEGQVAEREARLQDFFGEEVIIFKCQDQEYFSDVVIYNCEPSPYLMISLSLESIYNRHRLWIHPFKQGLNPYSLYINGYNMELKTIGNEAKAYLKVHNPLLTTNCTYTFWKKELSEHHKARYFSETIILPLNQDTERELKIVVMCNETFAAQDLPVILYLPSYNQTIHQAVVQKLLEKGVILVQPLNCRGSMGQDAATLLQGSKTHYKNYLSDLKQIIQFLSLNFSEDISIYSKGPISSYLSLLLNIQFPNFFTSSVFHDGIYDLQKIQNKAQHAEFFGGQEIAETWKDVNPLTIPFYTDQQHSQKAMSISILQNILLSTSPNQRIDSRKFIYRLRQNTRQKYPTVYLKEHDEMYQTDLYNLAFIYFKIRNNLSKAS